MTIHLSKDLERFIHDAVRAGLYPSEADVISDALIRLKETMPKATGTPAKKAKSAACPAEKEAAHARRTESTAAGVRLGHSASRSCRGYRRR